MAIDLNELMEKFLEKIRSFLIFKIIVAILDAEVCDLSWTQPSFRINIIKLFYIFNGFCFIFHICHQFTNHNPLR